MENVLRKHIFISLCNIEKEKKKISLTNSSDEMSRTSNIENGQKKNADLHLAYFSSGEKRAKRRETTITFCQQNFIIYYDEAT